MARKKKANPVSVRSEGVEIKFVSELSDEDVGEIVESLENSIKQKNKNVLKNISKQHQRVYGHIVKPGAIYDVSDTDLKSEISTMRVESAIKQGFLERL